MNIKEEIRLWKEKKDAVILAHYYVEPEIQEIADFCGDSLELSIKAAAASLYTSAPAFADDSGLEIDYLNGEPGIYSARFLGEDTSYDIKNTYILDKLKDVPVEQRSARFVCAIALADAEGNAVTKRATIEGYIGYEIRGENGFGYDPVFFVPEAGCTFAQLSNEQKNAISHRARALAAFANIVRREKDNADK